jgi:hypothetical protein
MRGPSEIFATGSLLQSDRPCRTAKTSDQTVGKITKTYLVLAPHPRQERLLFAPWETE